MHFYLYLITNKLNNKVYIGQHSTNDLEDGYMGSGKRLKAAIRKYGIENFEKKILRFVDSKEDLDDLERWIVTPLFILRDDVYNIVPGGSGGSQKGRHTLRHDDGRNIDLEELSHIGDEDEEYTPICPKCGCKEYYDCYSNRYKCKECGMIYSQKTTTIYKGTHLPIKAIKQIIYLDDKGASQNTISKMLSISQSTVCSIIHRYARNDL